MIVTEVMSCYCPYGKLSLPLSGTSRGADPAVSVDLMCLVMLWQRPCWGVVFIVAGSWGTAAVVAELSGRHVRNLCLRSEKRAAGSGAQRRGSGRLAAETPVLSERLLCRAEQVSPEQLSPSLEANTLWIIVIYPRGATSMLRSAPGCPSAFPPFFSPSFLPANTLPLLSWPVYCGAPLTKQLNDSAKYTNSLVLCLGLSLAARSDMSTQS